MTCRVASRFVQSYLDGELAGEPLARVSQHLDTCRHCGLDAATYQQIKASLGRSHIADVDPSAVARLRAFGRSLTE